MLIYLILFLILFNIKNMHQLQDFKTEFLIIKIKNFLFSLNLNEKYVSFDYLTMVLAYLIKNNSTKNLVYHQSIKDLSKTYSLSTRTIVQGLHKIVSMCNQNLLINFSEVNLNNCKTKDKIILLKNLAEDFLIKELK